MARAKKPISDRAQPSGRQSAAAASAAPPSHRGLRKTHVAEQRPPFDCIALLLQGGGALGAYQAGVYEALAEANLHPDWVAGISIGGINSAIIAGNPREHRVARLREFWELLARSPLGFDSNLGSWLGGAGGSRDLANTMSAGIAALFGVYGFYVPRFPGLQPAGTRDAAYIYDTALLKATLERLIDFDLINSPANDIRLSLGTVNVGTGRQVYFDVTEEVIRPEHVMASGALPAAFPAIEIDGEHYWDGGVVSNTPLEWLARHRLPDMLAFQVDLWTPSGAFPNTLPEVITRLKEIMNSSRTTYYSSFFEELNRVYSTLARYLEQVPEEFKRSDEAAYLTSVARRRLYHLVNLVYRPQHGAEGASKEFEFSRQSMQDRWRAGYYDTVHALRHPEVLERPPGRDSGIFVFDFPSVTS
jgi:NTE family protein